MALHPEVLWAQRSSATEPEKVSKSFVSHKLALFLTFGFSADAAERPVPDGQFARYY